MIVVWVADIGKVGDNFGWWRIPEKDDNFIQPPGGIYKFKAGVANDLNAGHKVAIGFECPLFLPVSNEPISLTKAREGERDRSWSFGAGTASLATGLVECVWIFENIKKLLNVPVIPSFNWNEFFSGNANLFLWEAFVTGKAKTNSHNEDAKAAAEAFWANYPHINEANSVTAVNPYSLIGAGLLRAGLSNDLSLLTQPCVVIKG